MLQNHENEDIYKLAYEIVDQYFGGVSTAKFYVLVLDYHYLCFCYSLVKITRV